MATQDHINKDIAEKWFNKGLQIGGGREPNKEDAPYRDAPKEGDPDYTPPPSFPGQDIPKLQLAHGVTQDGRHVAPTETYTEKTGAVQLPDGNWLMPTKDGKYRPATDEELLEIQYQFEEEGSGHEHKPSGWDIQGDGWDQAMYNPNDTPQRMFKVTDKDKQLNNPAWQRFMEGNPSYMYVPLKKADAKGLTDTLSPYQNQRTGSLRDSGLSKEEKKELLIRGAAELKRA